MWGKIWQKLLNDKNVTTFQVGRDRIRVGTNGGHSSSACRYKLLTNTMLQSRLEPSRYVRVFGERRLDIRVD